MDVSINKWGNSLAVRIPSSIIKTVGFSEGDYARLSIEGGNIVISPKTGYRLDDLLAGITPDNLHTEEKTGPEIGAEKVEW